MMTALLLYAYCSGLYSSRRMAKACAERVDFMMIVAHDAPDFRTIADFRKRHLPPLGRLFLQVLKLAEKAGLAKLGHVALDGTKIKANASKQGFYRDDHRRDAQSTYTSKAAAIVQALHLERRQHSRIQIIEGQNGELIDRETFEREYLKKPPPYLRRLRLGALGEKRAP